MSQTTQPEDPWAKWRSPAVATPSQSRDNGARDAGGAVPAGNTAPATVNAEKPVKISLTKKPVAPVAGTLSVRKPFSAPAPRVAPKKPAERKAHVATNPQGGVRLSKVMSERGLCSRREADLWIERGWVFVDGEQISELGSRINPHAEIKVSPQAARDQARQVTILLNKPVGYVSSQPEPGCKPAVTLVLAENQMRQSGDPDFRPWMLRGLAPAGRLDIDSSGLLVLTQDGRIAKKLIGEDSGIEKEYLVRVEGEMVAHGLQLLKHGLELDGKPLKPAWVKQLNEDQLHFILREGKKRQIRRMCELVGLKVIGLKRVRIGRVMLGNLAQGQWRFLREDEAF
jgi:23S rRNA pseudouridine2604 synthase